MSKSKRIAIIGSGPAALMCATELAISNQASSLEVHLFEKRSGFGRKLLIAGSSGLNISHEHTIHDFAKHYEGFSNEFWNSLLNFYGPNDWINFIEKTLEMETFLGTSQRYFVKEMKASQLLKKWVSFLEKSGVKLHSNSELTDFNHQQYGTEITFNHDHHTTQSFDQVVFALGGGSWESEIPKWYSIFSNKHIQMIPFEASNVGYEVNWNKKFLEECEGKPLKKIQLISKKARKTGELVITKYGIEGTPIYFCGTKGTAHLDLKPDLSEEQIFDKLSHSKENLSPMRRVKHKLGLCEASESLLFHHSSAEEKSDLRSLIRTLKHLPIELIQPRPLMESISSQGGVSLTEVNDSLEMKKFKGIYACGEMLDWDAPTGGFLIQACVSQGALAAKAILSTL